MNELPTPPNEPEWLDDICMVLSDEFQTPNGDGLAHDFVRAAIHAMCWRLLMDTHCANLNEKIHFDDLHHNYCVCKREYIALVEVCKGVPK